MQLGKQIAAGAGFLSNFALWSEAGYFDQSAQTKPLLHLWSLGVEEQFYIVWPLMLWSLYKARINPLIGIAGVGSFAINIASIDSHPIADFYSPASRFWELMLGCLLLYQHVVVSTQTQRKWAELKALAGCPLLEPAIFFLRGEVTFPGWKALIPTIGTYLLIDSGPTTWLNRKVFSARP